MAPAATDLITEVGIPGTATTLAAPGHTIGGTSLNVGSTANWPTATGVIFAMDTVTIDSDGNEVQVPGSYREIAGVVTSATSIGSIVFIVGSDANYSAGSTTRVYIPVAATWHNRIAQAITAHANQDGSLKTSAVRTALGLDSSSSNGWTVLAYTPASVTNNGNGLYDVVFNSVDLRTTFSNGARLMFQRTVTAPTQCTSLNGTNQYYSKTSPSGMTFTDDFAASAWVKLSSYATGYVISRYNGTSGWGLNIDSSGRIAMIGFNAGSANHSEITSYQSIPLNKWVHIAAQLDMSSFTNTSTTSYVMINGADVPAVVSRAGTNPTALVQAGNLEVGGQNGGSTPFPGKLAQVAVYSAKVTQATMQAAMNQTLAGTETSLISAYSFNNTINDLNTTSANNLTANNSAVATNSDSPFSGGTNALGGYTAGTRDFGEVFNVSFSTNTTVKVQVPPGYTIPTSGGVTAVSYSTGGVPVGWPLNGGIRELANVPLIATQTTTSTSETGILGLTASVYVPAGRKVRVRAVGNMSHSATGATYYLSVCKTSASAANAMFSASQRSVTGTVPQPMIAEATDLLSAAGSQVYLTGWRAGDAGTLTVQQAESGNYYAVNLIVEFAD